MVKTPVRTVTIHKKTLHKICVSDIFPGDLLVWPQEKKAVFCLERNNLNIKVLCLPSLKIIISEILMSTFPDNQPNYFVEAFHYNKVGKIVSRPV